MSLIQTLTKKINGVETEIAPRTFASAVTDSNGKTLEEIVNSEYELIEEITLTEDVARITRTQTPQGVNYDFNDIRIYAQTPTASSDGILDVSINDVNFFCRIGRFYDSTVRYSICDIKIDGGYAYNLTFSNNVITSTNNLGFGNPTIVGYTTPINSINKLSLSVSYGPQVITSGTNIKIYAK